MGLFTSVAGVVEAEITSADIPGMLTAIGKAQIPAFEVQRSGDLSVTLRIARANFPALRALAEKRGCRLRVKGRPGLYWTGKNLLRRPLLLAGMALLLTAMVYLPGRIFFVQVEGNGTLPDRLILARAEECGICFGASRREVRSEKLKNALLCAIPELQWAAVNTNGCVATISVRERTAAEEEKLKSGVSSIVAVRDGVITECTVTRGSPLCKVGQAVKAGEVLISGYTDCGLTIRAARAEGEVFAETRREISVISPADWLQRGEIRAVRKKYGLLFGKKRINFYKDSGISDTGCDKIYREQYLTLPGGFRLPVALVTETWISCETAEVTASGETLMEQMARFAEGYLSEQMISGTILRRESRVEEAEGVCHFYEEYTCREMIGRVKDEEIIGGNGKNN